MVNAIDIKEAAAQGLYQRPLTTAVIEKHLADLGIEPEFGTHSRIRGLSGVLPPHIFCLLTPVVVTCALLLLLLAVARPASCDVCSR